MLRLPFDDENLPLFTVGQAWMLEVQQAFSRRLMFEVVRPSRSSGGQRRYSRTEVTVVRYVAQLAIHSVPSGEYSSSSIRSGLFTDALLTALAERDELLAVLSCCWRIAGGSPDQRPAACG